MNVSEINPYTVMDRFPSHKEKIKQLFRNNRSFQTLCSDYHRCIKAMQFWNKSDLCEAPQRRKEYEALKSELEAEILQILLQSDNPSGEIGIKGK